MVPSLIMFFITAFLEQVKSIDYSGDEVQVTTTDGTECTAQKVSAVIPLGATRGLGVRETSVFYQAVCLWQSAQSLVRFLESSVSLLVVYGYANQI